MQIVIKIPKDRYKEILQDDYIPDGNFRRNMIEAVRNSTLLPEGHGRLIDADKTILKICGDSCGCYLEECGRDVPCYSVTRIESAPTIIEKDGD